MEIFELAALLGKKLKEDKNLLANFKTNPIKVVENNDCWRDCLPQPRGG